MALRFLMVKKMRKKIDIAVLGINPGSFIEPKVIEGKQLDPDVKNGVLANDTLKDKGYKIGDEVQVDGSKLN